MAPASPLPEAARDVSPLVFDLPHAVLPGRAITLTIVFRRGWVFEPYQGYQVISNWYPRLVWASRQADDFAARIRVPDSYKLLTSGSLDKSGTWRGTTLRQFSLILTRDLLATSRDAGDVLITALYTAKGAECAQLVVDTAADVIPFLQGAFRFLPARVPEHPSRDGYAFRRLSRDHGDRGDSRTRAAKGRAARTLEVDHGP
jgi:hypothetical protein